MVWNRQRNRQPSLGQHHVTAFLSTEHPAGLSKTFRASLPLMTGSFDMSNRYQLDSGLSVSSANQFLLYLDPPFGGFTDVCQGFLSSRPLRPTPRQPRNTGHEVGNLSWLDDYLKSHIGSLLRICGRHPRVFDPGLPSVTAPRSDAALGQTPHKPQATSLRVVVDLPAEVVRQRLVNRRAELREVGGDVVLEAVLADELK